MALRITETWNSRDTGLELGNADALVEYVITGTSNHDDAYAAVYAFASPTFDGLTFQKLKVRPLGGPNWVATLNYGVNQFGLQVPGQSGTSPIPAPGPGATPGETDALTDADGVSFTTVGESVKVHTSVSTRSKISLDGSTPPDFERMVGADGEGCEVQGGKLRVTLKRNLPTISWRYIKKLKDLTTTTNEGTWKGLFTEDAVLFLGAEGECSGPKGWALSYYFDIEKTSPIRNLAGDIVGELPPHHYAWTLSTRKESNGEPVTVPKAIYVEQVHERSDFDELNI